MLHEMRSLLFSSPRANGEPNLNPDSWPQARLRKLFYCCFQCYSTPLFTTYLLVDKFPYSKFPYKAIHVIFIPCARVCPSHNLHNLVLVPSFPSCYNALIPRTNRLKSFIPSNYTLGIFAVLHLIPVDLHGKSKTEGWTLRCFKVCVRVDEVRPFQSRDSEFFIKPKCQHRIACG